jgi:YQGE family putative transporter
MTFVRRLFLINTGWTLAMYLASSFVGAWFWNIGTGLRPILLFYATLFAVMVATFAVASRSRWFPSSALLLTLGIFLNALYLMLMLLLRGESRHVLVLLALLDGASGSFYWLSLFVLAATWVPVEHVAWYNSWTGTIEAVLGLTAPIVSGVVIRSFHHLLGYRLIFLTAVVALMISAAVSWSKGPPSAPRQVAVGRRARSPATVWGRLLWGFLFLGLRDGLYFFVPGLLLYIITQNAVWLGVYNAWTAGLQGLGFWLLTRPALRRRAEWGILGATALGLVGIFLLFTTLNPWTIMILGAVISLSYPPLKVRLESDALTVIGAARHTYGDRTRLTSVKEVWINVGRLSSLLILIGVLTLVPGSVPLRLMRWFLAIWSLLPAALSVILRGVVLEDQQPAVGHLVDGE